MHSICRICKTALIITNLSLAAFQIAYYVSLKSRTSQNWAFFLRESGGFLCSSSLCCRCLGLQYIGARVCRLLWREILANCCWQLLYRSHPAQINRHECRAPFLARPRTSDIATAAILKLIRNNVSLKSILNCSKLLTWDWCDGANSYVTAYSVS